MASRISLSIIPDAAGSRDGAAIGDDAVKDISVAGWLAELDRDEQAVWFERVRWVRAVDRMAEAGLLARDRRLARFVDGWAQLRDAGTVASDHEDREMLLALQACWFPDRERRPDDSAARAIRAWDRYVHAIDRYHKPGLALESMDEFERMLHELSGSMLLAMPSVPDELEREVSALGAADQLFNNLRDLVEDVRCGVCLFPAELMRRFGVDRDDLLASRFGPSTAAMLEYLAQDLGRRLCDGYRRLLDSPLPECWRLLVTSFARRHAEIAEVLGECHYVAPEFAAVYWERVRVEIVRARAARLAATTGDHDSQ